MVTRSSEALRLSDSAEPAVQQSGLGYARPDTAKYSQTFDLDAAPETPRQDALLNTILGVTQKLAQQEFQQSTEEAYLDGVAKAGVIESEDKLEGNILTRDWQRAGYRDTMGRLKAADIESKIAVDIPRLKDKPPEFFANYIAEKRRELMSSFEGMSLAQRKTMFAQVMMTERAAIKKHGVEHAKHIVDTKHKAAQNAARISVHNLNAAKGDNDAYAAATEQSFTVALHTALDPSLPTEVQASLIEEWATHALQSDNHALYLKFKNSAVTHPSRPDDPASVMFSILDLDKESKLDGLYRASLDRKAGIIYEKMINEKAEMEARWANPDTTVPIESFKEMNDFAERALQVGYFKTPAEQEAFRQRWYAADAKRSNSDLLANAWAVGDVETMHKLGAGDSQGMEAWYSTRGRKLPVDQAAMTLFEIGQSGQPAAHRKVGELLKPALASTGYGGQVDPGKMKLLAAVMAKYTDAYKKGSPGALHQLLSVMDEDSQEYILRTSAMVAEGESPADAFGKARAAMIEATKTGKVFNAEVYKQNAKDALEAVNSLEPLGMFGWLGESAKSFLSASAADRLRMATGTRWFENEDRVQAKLAEGKVAMAEEYNHLNLTKPYLPASTKKDMATAAVARRSIPTESGPLYLPRGAQPSVVFGTAPNVDNDRIGRAIDDTLKLKDYGNRMTYKVLPDNQLTWTEYNKYGQEVDYGKIDPRVIRSTIDKQEREKATEYMEVKGAGVKRTTTVDGKEYSVQFNGMNTAMVEPKLMFKLRDNLVKSEGVRDTPYKDLSGRKHPKTGEPIMTVGVGVSSHNDFYPKVGPDGKVAPKDVNESFEKASNEAAKTARRMMVKVGLGSQMANYPGGVNPRINVENAFLLFGELAYQGFPQRDVAHSMAQAMKAGDYPQAVEHLKRSEAWAQAGAERRKHYADLLRQSIKG